MILGRYTKQPSEVSDYDIDFSSWLRSDETLSTTSATYACTTSEDASLTVVDVSLSSAVVRVRLSGGADGEEYKVTVQTTSSSGRVDESEFKIKVREY